MRPILRGPFGFALVDLDQSLHAFMHRTLRGSSRGGRCPQGGGVVKLSFHHKDAMRGGRSGCLLAQHHMVYAVQTILASQHQQAGAEAFAGCIEASPVLGVKFGDLLANLLVQSAIFNRNHKRIGLWLAQYLS